MLYRNLLLIPASTSLPNFPSHEWVSRVAEIKAILFLQKMAIQKGNHHEVAELNEQLRKFSH